MKVVFVVLECESYAVSLFSRLLKDRGHQVYLVFDPRLFATDEISNSRMFNLFDIRRENIRYIKQLNPDVIGFSVYTQDYQYALDYARQLKASTTARIIFGGIHCVLCPEEVVKEWCIDAVCVGEGESAIIEFVENEGKQDILNLWFKNTWNGMRSLVNLDTLPLPDRDIFFKHRPIFSRNYTIATSRGCPYTCTFCASDALNRKCRKLKLGNYLRQRSVWHVMNELMWAKRKYKPKSIYFTDDNLTLNTNWLRKFASQYSVLIGLPFYCTANPGTIKDEHLWLLKKAGCQMIGFGLQSADEWTRVNILKRYGSNERIKQVARQCRKLGIRFSFDHIFNIPGSVESTGETVEFYIATKPDIINTFNMTYLPGIELNKHLDPILIHDINIGKHRTAMFTKNDNNLSTIFTLIPMLPKWLLKYFLNNRFLFNIRLTFVLRYLLKTISRLRIGRYSDAFFPLHLLLFNILSNIKIRLSILFENKNNEVFS